MQVKKKKAGKLILVSLTSRQTALDIERTYLNKLVGPMMYEKLYQNSITRRSRDNYFITKFSIDKNNIRNGYPRLVKNNTLNAIVTIDGIEYQPVAGYILRQCGNFFCT